MGDIFLSYASADLLRVQPLIRALERQGWSVWWDRGAILPGQNFDQVIEEALGATRCVLVVWSRASVVSDWVKAEAAEGRGRRILVPVTLDDIPIPLGFRQIQTARLLDWQDTGAHPEFDNVVRAVTNLLGAPPAEETTVPAAKVPTTQPPENQPGGEAPPMRQRREPDSTGEIARKDKATWSRRGKRRLIGAMVVTLFVLVLAVSYGPLLVDKKPSPPVDETSRTAQKEPTVTKEPDPKRPPKTLNNSIGMEFVLIPAGEFKMGSNDGSSDEKPVHQVRLSTPFYLGKYEVTQGQWQAVMENNPSRFIGDLNRPIENVSWEDVREFIRRLNTKEGGTKYRLPTEAEWEYAARAGSTTAYGFGNDARQLGEYAWYDANSGDTTHPVGQKKPNAWGLSDMHGNVWEWVQDWYGGYAAEAVTDPQGPGSGSSHRVLRGGSWSNTAWYCRSAFRYDGTPGQRDHYRGFRLLGTAP
jgi:formylglycine-generating enzyme required for sulfatase activity